MNQNLLKFIVALKSNSLKNYSSFFFAHNTFLEEMCALFYKEGLIQSYFLVKNKELALTYLKIFLRVGTGFSGLNNIKLISTPSKMQYISSDKLKRLSLKKYTLILSTSQGLMVAESCIKKNLGGVILLKC